jgi:hypothetical protein
MFERNDLRCNTNHTRRIYLDVASHAMKRLTIKRRDGEWFVMRYSSSVGRDDAQIRTRIPECWAAEPWRVPRTLMTATVYTNADVITCDRHSMVAEAVDSDDGRVTAVGSNEPPAAHLIRVSSRPSSTSESAPSRCSPPHRKSILVRPNLT